MQDRPDVTLDGAHRDARGELYPADVELIHQEAVIGLHAVTIVVRGKFHAEPVARLARPPETHGIEKNDVIFVRVDEFPRPDHRPAGEVVPLLAVIPVVIHEG